MTTEQIEAIANKDQMAGSDMDLQLILRLTVVPQFYLDVGDVRWRRVNTTLPLVAGTQQYDLPDNFFSMTEVYLPPLGVVIDTGRDGMKYIGEDPARVAKAEFNTVQSAPTAYYIVPRASDQSMRAIKFDAPSDAAYTAYYSYLKGAVFADLSAVRDMTSYVPDMLHMALVSGLRVEILLDRIGQKDPRYLAEQARYQSWVERAIEHQDLARRNYKRYVS